VQLAAGDKNAVDVKAHRGPSFPTSFISHHIGPKEIASRVDLRSSISECRVMATAAVMRSHSSWCVLTKS
jgi:hypothetical protein